MLTLVIACWDHSIVYARILEGFRLARIEKPGFSVRQSLRNYDLPERLSVTLELLFKQHVRIGTVMFS